MFRLLNCEARDYASKASKYASEASQPPAERGYGQGAEPPFASEASKWASEASQPPAGTRLKTGRRSVEKASIGKEGDTTGSCNNNDNK